MIYERIMKHVALGYSMTLEESGRSHEERDVEGKTTTIDAYGAKDTHIDEASGYRDIEEFPNEQKICDECGMVARNEEELESHVQSAHVK